MTNPLALIVEDDRDSARLYRRILEPTGVDSEIVYTRDSAIDWLEKEVPDFVLLDLRLADDESGSEVLEEIKNDARLSDTRVIIITAYSKLADGLEERADTVIIKPVKVKQLRELIAEMMP